MIEIGSVVGERKRDDLDLTDSCKNFFTAFFNVKKRRRISRLPQTWAASNGATSQAPDRQCLLSGGKELVFDQRDSSLRSE